MCFVDSRGELSIALSSFPGLPICLRRQFYWTSLVRLSESIVSGGSRTILIIHTEKFVEPCFQDGVSNPIFL